MVSNEFSPERIAEAEALLELDSDQLYLKLAKEEGYAGLPGDLLQRAKERLAIISARTKSVVCLDQRVQAAWNTEQGNRRVLLICTVADAVVAALSGVPVPGATVAALIVKEGLDFLCKDEWAEPE